jgi:hypothetical protein
MRSKVHAALAGANIDTNGAKIANDHIFFIVAATEQAKKPTFEFLGHHPTEADPEVSVTMMAEKTGTKMWSGLSLPVRMVLIY